MSSRSLDKRRWAIVGGGMLGMTLAHRLAQAGHRVTLFEAAPQLGGLAAAWQLGDVVWDKHYHVTLLSDHCLRSLLRELDLDEEIKWVETKTGFYVDGRLYSMSNSLEFLRFPPLGLIDKARLALTIMRASRIKDWRPLERIPVADWLEKWSGKRTFEKIWLPLLKAKLGDNYRKTSAAFIWSTIARMYAARRSGMKKELFGYVPRGYARVLERFAALLRQEGVETRLATAVRNVHQEVDGGVTVECEHVADGSRERAEFDNVVLAVPAPVISRICPQLTATERAALEEIEYQGILCASALLKRPLSPYYVTNITDEAPFTAVIEMTALVERAELGGRSLVYLPKYATADDPAWRLSDDELREQFVAALMRMYPSLVHGDIECFQVSRVKHVLAISTLGYSKTLPGVTTSLPGVQLVSSFQIVNGTLNVNETVRLAEDAARELERRYTSHVERPSLARGATADRECVAGPRQ